MIEDIKKIKDRVEYLLYHYPDTRDSDKLLWIAYMVIFYDMKSCFDGSESGYAAFKKLIMSNKTPTFESLTRVRRKFQEAGMYIGTKRMEKMEESEKVRDWANTTSYASRGEAQHGGYRGKTQ